MFSWVLNNVSHTPLDNISHSLFLYVFYVRVSSSNDFSFGEQLLVLQTGNILRKPERSCCFTGSSIFPVNLFSGTEILNMIGTHTVSIIKCKLIKIRLIKWKIEKKRYLCQSQQVNGSADVVSMIYLLRIKICS